MTEYVAVSLMVFISGMVNIVVTVEGVERIIRAIKEKKND